MGGDTRGEGSLKASGVEELSGWVLCLETPGYSLLFLLLSSQYFPVVTKWRGLCLNGVPTRVWAPWEEAPCSLSHPLWGRSTSSFARGFISWTSALLAANYWMLVARVGRMDKLSSPYWCRGLKTTLGDVTFIPVVKETRELDLIIRKACFRVKSCKKTNCKQLSFCGDWSWGIIS